MADNIEKKILVGIIGVAVVIAAGGGIIVARKAVIRGEEAKTPPPVPIQQATANAPATDASSAIAVGSEKGADKTGEKSGEKKKGGVASITWEQLYQLDYKTGKIPDSLKKINKTKVRIPGFIVPLSDDLRALKEFLLVPNAQACIHVPPPPPNLIIYVTLERALPIEKITNPSWVEGVITIEKTESEYGAASYKMSGEKMEEYKF